jgi:hypothetical protein
MSLGAIQERQKILQVFFEAVNGIGTSFLPSRFPLFETLEGLGFILSEINLPGIGNAGFFVLGFAIVRNIAKFMSPAALDPGPRIDQLTSGLKTGRAIHCDEFEVFTLKSSEKEILEEAFPRFLGFSSGGLKVNQFPFSEHRNAVGDEEPSIDVFVMDSNLQRDAIENEVLILIQKRPLVIGPDLCIEFLANVRDFCGRNFRIQKCFKESADLAGRDAPEEGIPDEVFHLGLETLIALENPGFECGITEPWDLKVLHKSELSVETPGIVAVAIEGARSALTLELEILFEGVFEKRFHESFNLLMCLSAPKIIIYLWLPFL